MLPRLFVALAVAFPFFLHACATTAQKEPVKIVDFGIYGSNRSAPELVTMTDEIPATIGTVFGIRVLAAGNHTGNYDFTWTFPEMQNPATGQAWTEMTGTKNVKSDEPQSFLVRINNDWEAKAGEWTIQLSRFGRVTATKTFQVRNPAAMAPIVRDF